MPFKIIRDDITKVKANVIVNTANPKPVIGAGTDSAIYRAAGETELLAARKKIGDIAPGSAAVTPAFRLRARHIIHTVGPAWFDGSHGERDILRSCYATSLGLAAELSARSIAFPLIATGVYGFPKDEALNIALSEIGKFLLTHDMEVILVVFDRGAVELSEDLVGGIEAFIDDHGVDMAEAREYCEVDDRNTSWSLDAKEPSSIRRRRERERLESPRPTFTAEKAQLYQVPPADAASTSVFEDAASPTGFEDAVPSGRFRPGMPSPAALPNMAGKSLDEVLSGAAGKSFQQRLFELIDRSGMDDVSVYKKANIDRKVFSRIRCKTDYRPKKKTAVAFAIALKLDMPTMLDLLSRAEIAFSPSSKFDLIITYFVTNGNYDIYEINAALFKYGQPILGE